MNCQKCNQPIELGAAFCGNCGEAIVAATPSPVATEPPPPQPATPQQNQPPSPIAQVMQTQQPSAPTHALTPATVGGHASMPAYALGNSVKHNGELTAWMAILFGIAGIAGGVIMALIGLAFGAVGIVMGTLAYSGTKRKLSVAGIVVSCIAVLVGLGVWVYAYNTDQNNKEASSHKVDTSSVLLNELSTPCYSLGFVDKLNVKNSADSCDAVAYDGAAIETSTNAYKVYANKSSVTEADFVATVKPAIEKDVSQNLSDFTIKNEQISEFAGSPAYIVRVANGDNTINIVEAAVLHKVGTGENVFILVHAVNAKTVDLDVLEAQWIWK